MRVLGVDIKLGKDVDKTTSDIDKQMTDMKYKNIRPQLDVIGQMGSEGVRIPYLPISIPTIYDLVAYSDTLRNIILALRKEIFRRGYEIKEKFSCKCINEECLKEFDEEVDRCDECGGEVRTPDIGQRKRLEMFVKEVNDNKQDIIGLLEMINDDLETIDDCYLIANKDYYIQDGERKGVIAELVRGHPRFMQIIADKSGRPGRDDEGNIVRTCIEHRNQTWTQKTECPICGETLNKAMFRSQQPDGQYIFYVKDEVFHTTKYTKSLTYGFSPIFCCWQKVITLMNMDKYMKDYYAKQRPPTGLLFVNTPSMASLEKAWNWMLDMFRKNPHQIPPIAIEGQTKGKFVEFVDFMRSMDEMKFTETREEFRRTIGGVFGVMPIFMGDLSTAGGLANEGLQITVTNRAVETGQGLHNNQTFPWLMKQFGITDYIMELIPPEQMDEKGNLEIEIMKAQHAKAMQEIGFNVTLNEDNEFEYSPKEEEIEPPQPSAFNPFGEQSEPEEQDTMGEPDSGDEMGKPELARKGITSESEGVFNPIHSRRRKEHIKAIIEKTFQDIAKEDGSDLTIQKVNPQMKEFIKFLEESVYKKKFHGLTVKMSNDMKDYLVRAMRYEYPMDKIIKYIKRKGGLKVTEKKAEAIAHTEMQSIQNKAREWAYKQIDPEDDYKYKWVGPQDNRTTDVCFSIKSRSKNGVSMDELRKILKEESIKGGFDGTREWTPHVGCRHTMIRSFD